MTITHSYNTIKMQMKDLITKEQYVFRFVTLMKIRIYIKKRKYELFKRIIQNNHVKLNKLKFRLVQGIQKGHINF